jgi:hypothetical protein
MSAAQHALKQRIDIAGEARPALSEGGRRAANKQRRRTDDIRRQLAQCAA